MGIEIVVDEDELAGVTSPNESRTSPCWTYSERPELEQGSTAAQGNKIIGESRKAQGSPCSWTSVNHIGANIPVAAGQSGFLDGGREGPSSGEIDDCGVKGEISLETDIVETASGSAVNLRRRDRLNDRDGCGHGIGINGVNRQSDRDARDTVRFRRLWICWRRKRRVKSIL